MRLKILTVVLALAAPAAGACTLTWDYPTDPIIPDGFHFYQGGVRIGTAGPGDRSIDCVVAGVLRGAGPVTATAFLGDQESDHSAPATFSGAFGGALRFTRP